MSKRRKKRKSHRNWLWNSGQRHCAYCGRRLSPRTVTADHVKPLSRGGYDRRRNVVAACSRCNSQKGSMSVDEFRAIIDRADNDSLGSSKVQDMKRLAMEALKPNR